MGKYEKYWLETVEKCSDCQYLSKLSGTFGHEKLGGNCMNSAKQNGNLMRKKPEGLPRVVFWQFLNLEAHNK